MEVYINTVRILVGEVVSHKLQVKKNIKPFYMYIGIKLLIEGGRNQVYHFGGGGVPDK